MLPVRRVLLADDDVEVRRGVAELLSPLGLEILHAESGLEAFDTVVRRMPIHLLVLDVHMPGATGLEVLERLQRLDPALDVPCIFYSGAATEALRDQAMAAGARAFFSKPVEPLLLRRQVQQLLDL